MPQAGLYLNRIGSMLPTLGKYRFAGDGAWVGLVNFHRFVRVGAAAKKDQEPYLDLRAGKEQILQICSNPGWGVLMQSSLMPQLLSDQVASQEEKFAAAFDDHCRWLLFLPKIEEQGKPVTGFELSMADAAQEEIEAFLRGIDPSVGRMLGQDLDRTFFLNPTFIESYARSEELWISTLGFLTGQVAMNGSRKITGG